MRLMMTIQIPVEHGNKSIADGSMTKAFESLFEKLKPEVAYFTMTDGLRTAIFVYELGEGEEYRLLEFHEPLFAAMGAMIDERPVLTWDDMAKGFADMAT